MKKHNVRQFNATGDGITDDRAAIQSAIDATIAAGGGVVFFPAGDYVVGKIPPRETSDASFFINGVTGPLIFEGEGAASIIRMAPGPIAPKENWAMFRVVAPKNVSFHHLCLHGNRHKMTLPTENNTQIHCMLLEQAIDVTVQNVEFRKAVDSGIVIEGAREAESGRLTVVGNLFVDSGSSGIILHGHGAATSIKDVVIQGNIVKHTSKKSYAVQLGNAHRVQFVANTIVDGEVVCGYLQDFMISNNMIVGGSGLRLAGLRLYGGISNGSVIGNIIRAEATSRGVEVQYHNAAPKKVRLAQNTIMAGDTGIIVNGQDISVSDNLIEKDPDGSGDVGISVASIPAALGDSIQVRNNQIRNFRYGILADGNQEDLTRLVVVGNQIRGSSPSPTGAAIHIRSRVPAATVYGNQADPGKDPLKLDSGYIVTAGGFAGNGSPEGVVAAEVGSFYTQLDANPVLPRLWVKEIGTGATGWVSYASRGLNVRMFGAKGDGRTDDREAIKNAMTAAVALGAEVFFPPGTYIVGQEPSKPFCLDLPGSNLVLRGVRGASWLKQPAGLPNSSVTLLHIDHKTNVTIRDLGFDGNWGNAITTISQASHGDVMPQETVNVISTTGFPVPEPSATFIVNNETITYTGKTETSFTGCTGGTSTLLRLQAVGYIDDHIGINHETPPSNPQTHEINPGNHGIRILGSTNILIDNCIFQQNYGDGIWIGAASTDDKIISNNIRIQNTDINMVGRNGIAIAQPASGIYIVDCSVDNYYQFGIDVGPQDAPVRDVSIERCFINHWWNPMNLNLERARNVGIALRGGKSELFGQSLLIRNIRVTDCTINAGCLIQAASDVRFTHNRIVMDWVGYGYAPILVQMFVDDIWVTDNYIYDRVTFPLVNSNHDASISVQVYGSGSLNAQPAGVHVSRNKIQARQGRHGIKIAGTGGFAVGAVQPPLYDYTGTAKPTDATTLTDDDARWQENQWKGYDVVINGSTASILSNTDKILRLYTPPEQGSTWATPLGNPGATPAVGPSGSPYTIYKISGIVEVSNNHIDCWNDGNGAGGYGIYCFAFRSGMRVNILNNQIRNAMTHAIDIRPYDKERPFVFLSICDNYAFDDQVESTCDDVVHFEAAGPTLITKMVLRNNVNGDGVMNNVTGLTSGMWLINDGTPQIWAGYGLPNGTITAPLGSSFHRINGGPGRTLWIKEGLDGTSRGWNAMGTPPAPAWTVDDGSGIGCPANATEWAAVIAAAALTGVVAVPDALWLCQEASGDLADSIGTYTLTVSGTVAYQQVIDGWERLGVKTTNNVRGAFTNTDAGVPNLETLPCSIFSYAIIHTADNFNRSILSMGTTVQAYLGGAAATRATSGANVETAPGSQYGSMRPYGLISDRTGTRARGFDDINKLSPPFSPRVSGAALRIGLSAVAPPTSRTAYAWAWFTPPSDAHLKAILTRLGWDILWT